MQTLELNLFSTYRTVLHFIFCWFPFLLFNLFTHIKQNAFFASGRVFFHFTFQNSSFECHSCYLLEFVCFCFIVVPSFGHKFVCSIFALNARNFFFGRASIQWVHIIIIGWIIQWIPLQLPIDSFFALSSHHISFIPIHRSHTIFALCSKSWICSFPTISIIALCGYGLNQITTHSIDIFCLMGFGFGELISFE